MEPHARADQGDDPDAEDRLDLAEEVIDGGLEGDVVFRVFVRLGLSGALLTDDAGVMLFLLVVSPFSESARDKGVQDGDEEDEGRRDVEGIGGGAGGDSFPNIGHARVVVLGERQGEVGVLGRALVGSRPGVASGVAQSGQGD